MSKDWKITEVDARLMPPAGNAKWWPLFREIMLRLEQTPDSSALRVVLSNGDSAAGAVKGLSRYSKERNGDGHLCLSWVLEDGREVLYARRGPKWSK